MSAGASHVGFDDLMATFDTMGAPEGFVQLALNATGDVVEAKAKDNVRAQGLILEGRLRSGIARRTIAWDEVIVGVFDVIYAAIHEFGGVITPKRAKWLVFDVDGETVFTKKVTIPARPYMRPAVYDNLDTLRETFAAVLRRTMLK